MQADPSMAMDAIVNLLLLTNEQARTVAAAAAPIAKAGGPGLAEQAQAHRVRKVLAIVQQAPAAYGPDRSFLLTLGLGGSASSVLAETAGIGSEGRALFHQAAKVRTDDLLLSWQDDHRPDQPTSRIPRLTASALAPSAVEPIRSLVTAMRARHLEGLARRARSIGYHREVMALADIGDQPTFLLYIESSRADWGERLGAYPDDEFTTWWNPAFLGLVGMSDLALASTTLVDWDATAD